MNSRKNYDLEDSRSFSNRRQTTPPFKPLVNPLDFDQFIGASGSRFSIGQPQKNPLMFNKSSLLASPPHMSQADGSFHRNSERYSPPTQVAKLFRYHDPASPFYAGPDEQDNEITLPLFPVENFGFFESRPFTKETSKQPLFLQNDAKVLFDPFSSFHPQAKNQIQIDSKKKQIAGPAQMGKITSVLRKFNSFESKIDGSWETDVPNSAKGEAGVKKGFLRPTKSGLEVPRFQPHRRRRVISCNCKNSRCLKLYCECFRLQGHCSHGCKCKDCKNLPSYATDRQKQIDKILKKNPAAFIEQQTGRGMSRHGIRRPPPNGANTGCNCKKSHCQKKYCECYSTGKSCAPHCSCFQCKNVRRGEAGEPRKPTI